MNGEAGTAAQQVFVLADQNFPALLPVSSSQQCLKILRIEGGSLQDLEAEFNKRIGNRRVMPGSLILVLSPAHLSSVGITAYINDFVDMAAALTRRHGREVKVGPLPPVLLAGCHHSTVVRELFEFMAWASSYYADCDFFLEQPSRQLRISCWKQEWGSRCTWR
jgi:hypothetical protein